MLHHRWQLANTPQTSATFTFQIPIVSLLKFIINKSFISKPALFAAHPSLSLKRFRILIVYRILIKLFSWATQMLLLLLLQQVFSLFLAKTSLLITFSFCAKTVTCYIKRCFNAFLLPAFLLLMTGNSFMPRIENLLDNFACWNRKYFFPRLWQRNPPRGLNVFIAFVIRN